MKELLENIEKLDRYDLIIVYSYCFLLLEYRKENKK